MIVMFKDWLSIFFDKTFHIKYNDSIEKSNFYVGELNLTPAEVAYLLAKFSGNFNLSLTELVDNMSDFSCYELLLAAEKIRGKNDRSCNY